MPIEKISGAREALSSSCKIDFGGAEAWYRSAGGWSVRSRRVAEVACLSARIADRSRVDHAGLGRSEDLGGQLGTVFAQVVGLFRLAMEHPLVQLGSWAPSVKG